MTQTPASTDGGQAPTSGLPQAGTSTTDGQAPVSQIAPDERDRIIERLRSEAASTRVELKKYKDDEAARAAAQMSELEKAQQAAADSQAQIESLAMQVLKSNVRDAVTELAGKFNFVISAKSLTKFLLQDFDAIEFDEETDEPTNIEKLLEKLAKAEPDLVRHEQQPRAPMTPAMNPARSGRTDIPSPGQQQPGKPRRLTEYGRGELFKI